MSELQQLNLKDWGEVWEYDESRTVVWDDDLQRVIAKLSKMEEAIGTVDRTANSLSWSQLIDALLEAGYKWTPEVRQLDNAIRALVAAALAGGEEA